VSEASVVVAGASGFAGALAASLVHRHPRLELGAATARADAGTRLDRLYPRYRVPIELTELDPDSAGAFDAAIVAYPHGAAAEVVARFVEAGVPVVDVSADFRLHDRDVYEETYGEHAAPELLADAVYGLTELHRDEIKRARLVANPGCYPTAAILGLAPLAAAGLADDVIVSAASGVSGAGRVAGDRFHFVSVDENFTPYGIEGHRHLPEIVQELEGVEAESGTPPRPDAEQRRRGVTFVPHLVPLDQGLMASCFVTPSREVGAEELGRLYAERYEGEPFVEIVDAAPGVREVRDTNLCRIHVAVDARTGRAMAFAAIDNLWKGAAGQAIQNLNLMLGFEETDGLL
jgi:N-acetyl-gamma-glutamyl-phosphate reductase